MTYDYFASPSDKLSVLDFVFSLGKLQVYDLGSEPDTEIREYHSTEEIRSSFDLENGDKFAVCFNLWSPDFKEPVQFRKITLNPKYCKGHTFRYASEGWGLIQLYFGGARNNVLSPCHIGHFEEKGALARVDTESGRNAVNAWNWQEIRKTSRLLKYQIHQKMAIRKIGSFGVLPGADSLIKSGLQFSN